MQDMNCLQPKQDQVSQVIKEWCYGLSIHTHRSYALSLRRLLAHTGKPFHETTLADLQRFADSLAGMAPSSQHTILSAIRAFFTFAFHNGYIDRNVGAVLRLPRIPNTLVERIIEQEDVLRMLSQETNPRNHALIRLLYAGALRVSEACDLRWRDLQPYRDSGRVTVHGKGGKTRIVLLRADTWAELQSLRAGAASGEPVFRSRKKCGALGRVQVWQIVKKAAQQAGVSDRVSPHWLRHAHATHALEQGASVVTVQMTLGHARLSTTERYLHVRPTDSSSHYLPV